MYVCMWIFSRQAGQLCVTDDNFHRLTSEQSVVVLNVRNIYCCKCFECNIMTAFTTLNIVKIHYNDSSASQLTSGSGHWSHRVAQLFINIQWLGTPLTGYGDGRVAGEGLRTNVIHVRNGYDAALNAWNATYCYRCVQSVSLSTNLSVMRLVNSASLCRGHSVRPLPNHFGLLL